MNISDGSIPFHYETTGEGMPFLAIHGWGVDHRLMSGCLEPVFSGNDAGLSCRRIYPDLPGMGKTPGPETVTGADDLLASLLDFIDFAIPDGRFLLAGESFGGYLSRAVLRKMPERIAGLLLIAPAVRPFIKTDTGFDKGDVPEHRVIEEDAEFMNALGAEESDAFRYMGVRLTRDCWNRFSRDVIPGIRAADKRFLENNLGANPFLSVNPDEGMAPFGRPTAIITGRQDASVGYRDMWSLIENFPRATYACLDGAGHNLQTERVPLFESLVRDWLERVARQGDA